MNESHLAPDFVKPPRQFPWGCLLGGCATVFLLMVGLAIGTGIGGYYFYKGQIAKYTSDTPKELPTVEYPPEEIKAITDRIDSFKKTIEKGESPPPMVLTSDDINALISQNKELQGKIYVRIDKGEVTADASFPMDALPGAKGRYFNGSVTADVSFENGVLIVTLADAEVNGQAVPQELIDAMSKENLAKDLYKNPEIAKTLSKFESLVIDDEKIILTPKAASEPGEAKSDKQ
jgi:hypothetical protein